MRLIDADVLKQHIDKLPALPDGNFAGNHSALKALINMQPTIEPEQRWIPVSETVDVPEHEVLACDKYGTELIGFLYEKDEQWMCESDECIMYDVIAWMPRPEPYKGDAE